MTGISLFREAIKNTQIKSPLFQKYLTYVSLRNIQMSVLKKSPGF